MTEAWASSTIPEKGRGGGKLCRWGEAHTHTTGLALRARVLHQNTQISVIKGLFLSFFFSIFLFLLILMNFEFTLFFSDTRKFRRGRGRHRHSHCPNSLTLEKLFHNYFS